jgi:tetratricopeptide (TPR) repeat protein
MSQFDFAKAELTLENANQGIEQHSVSFLVELDEAGAAYHAHGLYDKAESCYMHVVSLKKANGITDQGLIQTFHRLGVLYRLQDKFPDAERCYSEAINVSTYLHGEKHPKVVDQKAYLAGLYHHYGRHEEALKIALEALNVYSATEGQESHTVAICHFALAFIYARLNLLTEGKGHLEMAQRITSMQVYASDETIAQALLGMVVFHYRHNEIDSAEVLFKSACLLQEDRLWGFHPIVPETLVKLGTFFETQRSNEKAELCYQAALKKLRWAFGDRHPYLSDTLKTLIKFYTRTNNPAKADEYKAQLEEITAASLTSFAPNRV